MNPMSNTKRRLPFIQVDVFTSVPLEGNQLAVFADGSSLSDAEMQAMAKETNLSETTFILPRDAATERERGVRVRIFTTDGRASFRRTSYAGHCHGFKKRRTAGNGKAEEIALDLNVGRIPVRFSTRDGLPFGLMTQRDPEFKNKHSREDVARAAGLSVNDIADDLPIQTVSTGNAFAIVPLKSLSALQNLSPTWSNMKAYLDKSDAKFFYFVSRETVNPEARLQSRMIFYNGEDPATGSAAGPCAAWAVQYGVVPADQQVLMEQGVEMKRRSRIFFSAGRNGDKIVNVRVGGHVTEVARGEFIL